jgi:plasmid stability protein
MASITIRDLDDELKRRLRFRAAEHGRSMEEEARNILRVALPIESSQAKNLGTAIHQLFKSFGGVELDLPPREPMREPTRFD